MKGVWKAQAVLKIWQGFSLKRLPSQPLKVTFQLLRVLVEINAPTFNYDLTRTRTKNLLIQSLTPYTLGHRADGKSEGKMIKIPINVFSYCQRAVSLTSLPGLGPWITWFVVRCLIHLVTGVKIWQGFSSKRLPSQFLKVTFQLLRVVVDINNPTLRLLKLWPYLDSNLFEVRCLSIRPQGRWKKW